MPLKKLPEHILSVPLAGLLMLFSLLPLRILYGISSVLAFLMIRFFPYRKKLVMENLENSFPEKSPEEREAICRGFYRHLCDVVVEVIKMISMRKRTLQRRCTYSRESLEIFERFHRAGKNVIIALGHQGNWEWGGAAFNLHNPSRPITAYRPLKNKVFDRLVYRIRARFGTDVVPMKHLTRKILTLKNQGVVVGLLADQAPPPGYAYWTEFLSQETPVYTGPEKLAKKMDMPVVYCAVNKQRRGHYLVETRVVAENPREMPDEAISRLHTRFLEEEIRKEPRFWLWSHRRWKHKLKKGN